MTKTKADQIRDYLKEYPEAKSAQVARALGFKPNYVHSIRNKDKYREERRVFRYGVNVENLAFRQPELAEWLKEEKEKLQLTYSDLIIAILVDAMEEDKAAKDEDNVTNHT
jgi:hypothetical protein